MKMTRLIKSISIFTFASLISFSSCIKDLDTLPIDPNIITSANVYDDPESYRQVLAKIYAGLAVTGQRGPTGMPDIAGIDEGFSSYLRMLWSVNVLPSDEAVIAFSSGDIAQLHEQSWTASHPFMTAMYYRIFYQITLVGEFLRESTDQKLDQRGIHGSDRELIAGYRAEARFIRALSYYHAIDMYGNVPFITENDQIGAFLPQQILRPDLFEYIENELLEIEDQLPAPHQNEYGRVDRAAMWMLLSKLYLNAEVYTQTPRYTDAITYLDKLFQETNYQLEPVYHHLFLADNHSADEIIMRIAYAGASTQSWGGITMIISAAVGGNMNPADFGIAGGWGGTRVTPEFVAKFEDPSGETDSRALFHTDGQTLEIDDVTDFTQGYAVTKFKNVTSYGEPGSHNTFPDTDFPVFRLADAYLMYAEAVLRGGAGGDVTTALEYVNKVRERAYGDTSGNISAQQLTLDFLLDERARELYWEGHRRSDLIRFNRFSDSPYVWAWKGGVRDGIPVDSRFNLHPLPDSDIVANPNLDQNQGY
jgi:starch-binding outer membrane protein, SusD/RagB family